VVLRGVIFDLFGTLVEGWGTETAAAKGEEIAEILGAPTAAFRDLMESTYTLRANGQLGPPEAMLRELSAMIGHTPSQEAVERAATHRIDQFREVLREPRPEVRSLLAVLRDRGYRLGLISDCSGETPSIWRDLVWTGPIQAAIFSWCERARKPDPRLYRQAAKLLRLDCAECLYVGDGGSQELTGAEAVGMPAYQYLVPRADGDRVLQYDPGPVWRGPTISTLSEVLAILSG